MLKLSVHQFVAHLPAEQQGPVLVSQEAFLAFLRSEFHRNEVTKRALVEAATAYAKREQVMVHCLADERYAAKAVIYAYMRLGDEFVRRGKVRQPRSHFRTYRRQGIKQAPRAEQRNTARFRTAETFINGRRERIEQYPANITWAEARAFQKNALYDLPDIDLEPEYRVTSETAHFGASVRPTGWGWLMVEGQPVERVRCWENV